MKIVFLGPRPNELPGSWNGSPFQDEIKEIIKNTIERHKMDEGPAEILTSLAPGIDRWAGFYANAIRMSFDVYIPYDKCHIQWPEASRTEYLSLLKAAKNKVVIDTGGFEPKKIFRKDEQMVEDADVIYHFFPKPTKILGFAKKLNKQIVDLLPQDKDSEHFITL